MHSLAQVRTQDVVAVLLLVAWVCSQATTQWEWQGCPEGLVREMRSNICLQAAASAQEAAKVESETSKLQPKELETKPAANGTPALAAEQKEGEQVGSDSPAQCAGTWE